MGEETLGKINEYYVKPSRRIDEMLCLEITSSLQEDDRLYILTLDTALDVCKKLERFLELEAQDGNHDQSDFDLIFRTVFGVSRKEYAEIKLAELDKADAEARKAFKGDRLYNEWIEWRRERLKKIGGMTSEETL